MKNLSLIPMTYPWAWELSRNMLENTWTPFEHPQGQDRAEYPTLDLREQFVFRQALAYLTTSDIQIGDNAAEPIQRALSVLGFDDYPEIGGCIKTQAFQEWIHTMSYQHQLETILSLPAPEQAELYRLWESEPAMRAKVEFADEVSETLNVSENPSKLLAALWWYYQIYEGAWFMGGFNPLFAISYHRAKMHGTVVQLKYIRRDESEHIALGQQLFLSAFAEHPRAKPASDIADYVARSRKLESDWANWLLKEPILGYHTEVHMEHYDSLVTARLNAIGLPHAFDTKSPLRWLSAFADLRVEANFFESRVTEYRKGADLKWGDEPQHI